MYNKTKKIGVVFSNEQYQSRNENVTAAVHGEGEQNRYETIHVFVCLHLKTSKET
jgi:hypothetical protein